MRFLIFILKQSIGFLFINLGGIFLLKRKFKSNPIFIVLNYHNFSKYNNYKKKRGKISETGYKENFSKQLKFLKKHFIFLYPEEFFEGEPPNGLNVLITFDDGYKDNFDIAFPILKKYNAKAIFFIVTKIIGTDNWLKHDKMRFLVEKKLKDEYEVEAQLKKMNQGQLIESWIKQNESLIALPQKRLMMNWQEVKEMVQQGLKIAPHTHQHSVLSTLDYEKQKNEIVASVKTIKKQLNIDASYFAYPNGRYNDDSLNILLQNQIQYSFTTQPGFNSKKSAHLKLKRIGINPSDSIGVLLLKLYLNRNK